MKQKNNKCVTKITSSALALLLASGCIIGNSKADGTIQGEGKNNVQIGREAQGQKDNFANVGNPNNNDTTQKDKGNKPNNDLQEKIKILESNLEELPNFYSAEAGYNETFKNKLKEKHTEYSNLLKNNPTTEQLTTAINDIHNLTTVEGEKNKIPKKQQDAHVNDIQNNGNQGGTNTGNTTEKAADKNQGEVNTGNTTEKPADKNQGEANTGNTTEKPADKNQGEANTGNTTEKPSDKNQGQTNVGSNTETTNQNQPAIPSANDSKKSKEIKDKIAGEINKFKALLNDKIWTVESIEAAKSKINKLELLLNKNNLTEKDLSEAKATLNDIQINVLKKKAKTDIKKVTPKTVIKTKSNNVQTGVESLASVLLTLGSSSLALFASKKRK